MSSAETSVLSPSHNEGRIRELVERNCMLYLPPNRFEEPAWLNGENLTAKARHMDLQLMRGHTDRQIINYSPLHDNQNWLFDVVYDFSVFERRTRQIAFPIRGLNESQVTLPL